MSGGLQAAWELLGFPAIVGLGPGLANSRKPMGASPNWHLQHDLSTVFSDAGESGSDDFLA
jgi:hypothetical protein